MHINWLKLDVNILDNTKIRLIRKHPDGDSIIILWLGLLCFGMKSEEPGVVKIADGLPYTADELSTVFEIPTKTVQLGIELFMKYGMIQATEGGLIEIIGFRESQSIDKIEYQKAKNRAKVAKYRQKQKALEHVTVTGGYVTVSTPTEKSRVDKSRVEESKLDENREDSSRVENSTTFTTPTTTDIEKYFIEIGHNTDSVNAFFDYNEGRGWKVGNAQMKDWKAAARRWVKNEQKWEESEDAWQMAYDCATEGGAGFNSLPEEVVDTINACGGMGRLRNADEYETKIMRKEFAKKYLMQEK